MPLNDKEKIAVNSAIEYAFLGPEALVDKSKKLKVYELLMRSSEPDENTKIALLNWDVPKNESEASICLSSSVEQIRELIHGGKEQRELLGFFRKHRSSVSSGDIKEAALAFVNKEIRELTQENPGLVAHAIASPSESERKTYDDSRSKFTIGNSNRELEETVRPTVEEVARPQELSLTFMIALPLLLPLIASSMAVGGTSREEKLMWGAIPAILVAKVIFSKANSKGEVPITVEQAMKGLELDGPWKAPIQEQLGRLSDNDKNHLINHAIDKEHVEAFKAVLQTMDPKLISDNPNIMKFVHEKHLEEFVSPQQPVTSKKDVFMSPRMSDEEYLTNLMQNHPYIPADSKAYAVDAAPIKFLADGKPDLSKALVRSEGRENQFAAQVSSSTQLALGATVFKAALEVTRGIGKMMSNSSSESTPARSNKRSREQGF